MRLGKRERSIERAAMARACKEKASGALPACSRIPTMWDNMGTPVNHPSRQWGYTGSSARRINRK